MRISSNFFKGNSMSHVTTRLYRIYYYNKNCCIRLCRTTKNHDTKLLCTKSTNLNIKQYMLQILNQRVLESYFESSHEWNKSFHEWHLSSNFFTAVWRYSIIHNLFSFFSFSNKKKKKLIFVFNFWPFDLSKGQYLEMKRISEGEDPSRYILFIKL
jgi:hypothetical protein